VRKKVVAPPQLSFDFATFNVSEVDASEIVRCSKFCSDEDFVSPSNVIDLTGALSKRKVEHRQTLYREILDSIRHLS
jgi:hypothetical protein